MPSVSTLPAMAEASPQAAASDNAITSQVSSLLQQRVQLFAAIEQFVIGEYQAVGHDISQAVYSFQQQVDRFLGINLNPATSSNTSESGSGRSNASGAGSGSGATTNHNTQNQPSNNTTQPSGQGSGSGSSATATQANRSEKGATKVHPLTSGGCGSGSTTVSFGETGSATVYEEVNCNPTSIQVPIIVGNPDPNCPVSVQYNTVDGTATAGTDYTYESGTATFDAAGDPVWINIPILDDGTDESQSNDIFYVQLSNPVNATIGLGTFTVYILEQQQNASDTLRWNPCPGEGYNASTVTNWYDVTGGFQLEKGDLGPNPSSPIQFDAYPGDTPYSNAPITWDQSYTVASISVQGGYNAAQTVNYGVGLEMDGAYGVTLTVDSSSTADYELQGNNNLQTDIGSAEIDGTMNVNFLAAGSVTNINGTNEIVDGNIDYGSNGKVNVYNGGTLNLGLGNNKNQETGSPINVTNGTLTFGDSSLGKPGFSTFRLTTASADINLGPNGTMQLYQTGGTLIDNTLGGDGAVISNSGAVNLNGVGGGGATTIAAPLQNHGKLKVIGGDWTFSQKDASGNDLSMDAGSITLTINPPKIYCFHGYTQTGGTFSINTTQATLAVTVVPANFNGGTLTFGTTTGVLNTGGIAFNGATLNMSITADSSTSNVINCTSCTIKGSSTINVTLNGDQTVYSSWTLINGTVTGDFQPVNLPSGIFEDSSPNSPWGCFSTD